MKKCREEIHGYLPTLSIREEASHSQMRRKAVRNISSVAASGVCVSWEKEKGKKFNQLGKTYQFFQLNK